MYVIGNYGSYSVLQQQKVYISKLNIILVQVSYPADMTHHYSHMSIEYAL